MKFKYYYKKSDGIRREAEIESPTRDEAFAALREVGIRPIKMFAQDGSKENGAPQGGSRAVWVAAVLAAALVGVVIAYFTKDEKLVEVKPQKPRNAIESEVIEVAHGMIVAKPMPRRQLPKAVDGWTIRGIFDHSSDEVLALYAEPGKRVKCPSLTEEIRGDFIDALDGKILIKATDDERTKVLKRIVVGVRDEVAVLLKSGKSVEEAMAWLEARQEMEIAYRAQVLKAVKDGDETDASAQKKLRTMGMSEK